MNNKLYAIALFIFCFCAVTHGQEKQKDSAIQRIFGEEKDYNGTTLTTKEGNQITYSREKCCVTCLNKKGSQKWAVDLHKYDCNLIYFSLFGKEKFKNYDVVFQLKNKTIFGLDSKTGKISVLNFEDQDKAKRVKPDSAKKYEYEICVYKESKPGHIIINRQTGIADTTVASVWGQVIERKEPMQFVNVSFTDSQGQIKGTVTDANGNYRISLQMGNYIVKFQYIANNTITIDKLQLGTGQIQEINVDLGKGGGFYTYSITSEKQLTTRELKQKEKELTEE